MVEVVFNEVVYWLSELVGGEVIKGIVMVIEEVV